MRGMTLGITVCAIGSLCAAQGGAKTVWLSELDLTQVRQAFADARKDRSIDDKPLSIGGYKFERGIGTHAESCFELALKPGAERFLSSVGIHDEVGKNGSVARVSRGFALSDPVKIPVCNSGRPTDSHLYGILPRALGIFT